MLCSVARIYVGDGSKDLRRVHMVPCYGQGGYRAKVLENTDIENNFQTRSDILLSKILQYICTFKEESYTYIHIQKEFYLTQDRSMH